VKPAAERFGVRRLIAGGIAVAILLAAIVLVPYLLYRRGKAVQDRLQERVDFIDISLERAGSAMAHRERHLRLFLLTRKIEHWTEVQHSAPRVLSLLDEASRHVPDDRPEWSSTLGELRELATQWERAAASLAQSPRAVVEGDVMLEEARGRPGPIYQRYRDASSKLGDKIHLERLALQDQNARLDLVRTLVPVPLALIALFVIGYVVSLSSRVENLLKTAAEQRQRLAAILEQMADPVLVADATQQLVLANGAAQKLLGVQAADPLEQLLASRTLHASSKPIQRSELPLVQALNGHTVRGMELVILRDSSMRQVSASASPIIDDRGERVGAVMVLRDLTDRIRYERARLKAEKLGAIATMAERIAHDFGNYLEAAAAATVMVEHSAARDDTERHRWTAIIRDTVEGARVVLESLRSLAFTGAKRPTLVECNVDEMLSRAVELARLARPELARQVEITEQRSEVRPIRASMTELLRSLVNILVNAFDAMPNGGTLSVSLHEHDDHVVIVIADTGIGIHPENLDRVFELYFTTKSERGSGIGLTAAREVVHMHGGSISLESQVGKGSAFTVRLPIDLGREPNSEAQILALGTKLAAGERELGKRQD